MGFNPNAINLVDNVDTFLSAIIIACIANMLVLLVLLVWSMVTIVRIASIVSMVRIAMIAIPTCEGMPLICSPSLHPTPACQSACLQCQWLCQAGTTCSLVGAGIKTGTGLAGHTWLELLPSQVFTREQWRNLLTPSHC